MEFIDYSTRYREGLDLVLKGISSSVKGGEKVKPPSMSMNFNHNGRQKLYSHVIKMSDQTIMAHFRLVDLDSLTDSFPIQK